MYCAECLLAGAAPKLEYKGTGNESQHPFSKYVYIVSSQKDRPQVAPKVPAPSASASHVMPIRPVVDPLIRRPVPSSKPDLCPHGGIIVNGLSYCYHCSITKDKSGDDGPDLFRLFLDDLFQICGREGRRAYFRRIDNNEMTQHAFVSILGKLKYILKATNPRAMARIVARNAITDLKKKAVNWREVPTSDLHVFDPSDDGEQKEIETTAGKLEALSARNDPYWLMMNTPGEAPHQFGGVEYDIPGGESLWKPACYRQLEILLEAAMESLPKPPEDRVPMSVSMMIKRWVGYFEELGKQTYEHIAADCPAGTQPYQVKYLIRKGLKQAQAFIIEHSSDAINGRAGKNSWMKAIEKTGVKK